MALFWIFFNSGNVNHVAFICLQNGCCAKPPSQDFNWIFSSFFFLPSLRAGMCTWMGKMAPSFVLFLSDLTYLVRAVGARAVLIPLILKCHVDRERMGGRIGWEQRDIRQKAPGILYLHRVSFFFLVFLMSQGYKGAHKDNGAMVYTCFLSTQVMPHRSFI